MNELITVNKVDDRITVLGRDLHRFLEIGEKYTDWMKRMIDYGFVWDSDYYVISEKRETTDITAFGGKRVIVANNHQLSLDMAKEISMIQRNEKGKQARQYFIECEKKLNTPICIEDMIIQSAQNMKELRLEQEQQQLLLIETVNKVKILEAKQTNSPYEFFSVVGYCNLKGIKCELSQAIKWGKEASKISNKLNVKMGQTPDPRFGQVKTYHVDILKDIIS